MAIQQDLFQLLGTWIDEAEEAPAERVEQLRDEFGRLDREVFGDSISERCNNPVAMQYDRVRNELVRYSGEKDPDDLEMAKQHYAEIMNPDIEDFLRDSLVVLVLAGRHYPEGLLLQPKEAMVHPNDVNGEPSRFVQKMQEAGLRSTHWPTLALDTKYLHNLQSTGYALVIHDRETGLDRLRLTNQGYVLYHKMIKTIGDDLSGK